jgi:hypothetical protein
MIPRSPLAPVPFPTAAWAISFSAGVVKLRPTVISSRDREGKRGNDVPTLDSRRTKQVFVLLHERVFGLCQHPKKIAFGERLECRDNG